MQVIEAIEARRSVRKFKDKPVSQEQLTKLLEAARLAPSAMNAQPWRFKIVNDKADIEWLSGSPTRGQKWVAGASAVIICCADLTRFLEDAKAAVRFLRDNAVLPPEMQAGVENFVQNAENAPEEVLRGAAGMNCAIALTQMMLRAVELGLGTCWIGMYDEEALRQRFALPENMAVTTLLAVGHPDESPASRPRKELREIILA